MIFRSLLPLCLGWGVVGVWAQSNALVEEVMGPAASAAADESSADGSGQADGKNADGEEEQPTLQAETIERKRAAARANLQERRDALESADIEAGSGEAKTLAEEIRLLEELERIYGDQLRAVGEREDLQAEQAELQRQREDEGELGDGIAVRPTFAALESLYDQRDELERTRRWLERDFENAEDGREAAQDAFDEAEKQRRLKEEEAEDNPGEHLAGQHLARLQSTVAEQTLRLRDFELATLQLQEDLIGPRLELVQPRIEWVVSHLVRDSAGQAARQRDRAAREERLREAHTDARETAARASSTLARLESEVDSGDAAVEENGELEAWRQTRRLESGRLALLGRQLARLETMAAVEAQRLDVLFGEMDEDTAEQLAERNDAELERLRNARRQHLFELIRTRRVVERGAGAESEARQRSLAAAKAWVEVGEIEHSELQDLIAVRERLQEELGRLGVTVWPTWEDAWPSIKRTVSTIWMWELFTVDDQPFRVRTLLAVGLLVMLGALTARRISSLASDVAVSRFKWSRGRAAAWRTLLYYGFLCFIVLSIFSLFHLSLTQFSVVSGALAVGLGFGSQNLLNNFISGIILLVERPITEGALIEFDDEQYWVERIGMRSTVVRSFDNTHIVVPNSRLIEQSVTNWTLSDDVVRQKVAVGVAYGTDTRKVEKLLHKVLDDLDVVLDDPEPIVLFDAFGDNSLNFLAILHTRLDDRLKALNEVRHTIAEAFAAEGIVIAFPQRDLHFDSDAPLQIELTRRSRQAVDPQASKEGDGDRDDDEAAEPEEAKSAMQAPRKNEEGGDG
ncbi:mechanosensitive ion channel domain-containing protein [Actomonas aquatica]|uniref:Mechanosensitive ion channel n=1 Tax=Actomonas aquatica TaxID=2866162 RepID=A0ABZ1CE89_9BACT|nr:mechanosensitive ion channel domain-containing protein [Opitutus sp. WL0086]WRQ89980.1 mechanosensitive ion channel [Opitutus sp. WL0086]